MNFIWSVTPHPGSVKGTLRSIVFIIINISKYMYYINLTIETTNNIYSPQSQVKTCITYD